MHGGDIYQNKVKYDFSVNINPLGLPRRVKAVLRKSLKNAVHYPDINCSTLKKALSKTLSVDEDAISFGNGASELIFAFVRAVKAKSALLFAPSFSGYASALRPAGAKIDYFHLREEDGFALSKDGLKAIKFLIMSKKYDSLVLANPNNPNGKLMPLEMVKEIADACEASGTRLLIDECFIELTGKSLENSFIPLLKSQKYQNIVVLRAFTKTFAIPGVRLGYSVSSAAMAQKIKEQLPEWNVSVLAQEAGDACLSGKKYLARSKKMLAREREYLLEKLSSLGFKVFPSDANYILFKDSSGKDLKRLLLEKKVLIRSCADYEGLGKEFYRVAVKTRRENRRLIHFLFAAVSLPRLKD